MKRASHRRGRTAARHGAPQLRLGAWTERELVVDLFAGGGGASEGIARALGRHPDIAVNHDPMAIEMHKANHPTTVHFCESVFKVTPRDVVGGRPVGLLWASPDCTHFSKSKGGKPRSKKIRGLAWVVVRWAKEVAPRVIALENVEEFADWGPLGADNLPDKARAGKTFRAFVRKLESYGYTVEHRILVAADYGAPTTRKRLFMVARRDGRPITWPEPTHAKTGTGARRWRAAAEVIDWSIPCPSIFERSKPLAEPTLRRIAVGIWRYVLGAARPFIVPVTHPRDARVHSIDEPVRTVTAANRGELALVAPTLVSHYGASVGRSIEDPAPTVTAGGGGHTALVAPTLIHRGNGEREGQAPRVYDIHRPVSTVVAQGQKHGLVAAFLTKHYGSPPDRMRAIGSEIDAPVSTVTAKDHHALSAVFLDKMYGSARAGVDVREPMPTVLSGGGRGGGHLAEVRAFLVKYYGGERGDRRVAGVDEPLATITTAPRFGLVTIDGDDYAIADVGMRMLSPRELFRAQGFSDDYVIDPVVTLWRHGKHVRARMPKTHQIAKAGNSVSPNQAEAIVRANFDSREAVAA